MTALLEDPVPMSPGSHQACLCAPLPAHPMLLQSAGQCHHLQLPWPEFKTGCTQTSTDISHQPPRAGSFSVRFCDRGASLMAPKKLCCTHFCFQERGTGDSISTAAKSYFSAKGRRHRGAFRHEAFPSPHPPEPAAPVSGCLCSLFPVLSHRSTEPTR